MKFPLAQLKKLQRARTLVRIEREALEDGYVKGCIVGTSTKLLAIAALSDTLHPNGFTVIRTADVSKLQAPDPYAGFVAEAMQLRGDVLPRLPRLDLTSWSSLLPAAPRRFPLVTLHVQEIDPEVCYIGRPLRLASRGVILATIGADATWDHELLRLAWADITQVDFGGAYEEALALVARSRAKASTRPGSWFSASAARRGPVVGPPKLRKRS